MPAAASRVVVPGLDENAAGRHPDAASEALAEDPAGTGLDS